MDFRLICVQCRAGAQAWPLDADLVCSNVRCRHGYEWLTPGIPVVASSAALDRVAASDTCGDLPAEGELGPWLKPFGPEHPGFRSLARAAIFLRAMRAEREERFYVDLCDALLGGAEPSGEMLDLGCGAGNLAFELARRSRRHVTGLDLDAHLLRWAERALDGGEFEAPVVVHAGRLAAGRMTVRPVPRALVRFACGNLLDPPFEAATFDLVALVNVLDEVPYPAVALQQAVALLKPGGHLLFASPDAWNGATTPVERWLAATGAGWDRVFEKAGLETVARIDDLEWRLEDSPRLHHLYRVHGRLLRKP